MDCYAGESPEVIKAMIAFRNQLLIAEEKGAHSEGNKEWEELNRRLIQLSKALRESSPTKTLNPSGNKPPS